MALVKCKECGASVSSSAKVCPQCGTKKPAPKSKSYILWLIGAFALIAIILKPSPEEQKAKIAEVERQQENDPKCAIQKASGQMGSRACDLPKLCKETDSANQKVADSFGRLRESYLKNEREPSEVGAEIATARRKNWEAAQEEVRRLSEALLQYRAEDITKICPQAVVSNLGEQLQKVDVSAVGLKRPSSSNTCDTPPMEMFEVGSMISTKDFLSLIESHCQGVSAGAWGAELVWENKKWSVSLSKASNGMHTVQSMRSQ